MTTTLTGPEKDQLLDQLAALDTLDVGTARAAARAVGATVAEVTQWVAETREYLLATTTTMWDPDDGSYVVASNPVHGTETPALPRGVLVHLDDGIPDEIVLTPERARRIGEALIAAADVMQ